MNARRVSQRARYSLESKEPGGQQQRLGEVGLYRTLIFAGDDKSIHIVLLLSHELSESLKPFCRVDSLHLGCAHREWSESWEGRALAAGVAEEGDR